MEPVKVILLTSAGTGTAFASSLALRRLYGNDIKLIVADSNPKYLVTSSLLADKFIRVPLNMSSDFIHVLENIIIEEDIETYIPHIDQEIYLGALLYEDKFSKSHLKIQVKNSGVADICLDKFKSYQFLSEANVLTPKCFLENELKTNNEQVIVKPRRGFGSTIIEFDEIKYNISKFSFENFIYQQRCEGPEITVDVCYDKNHNYFNYLCRERIETKSGVCTKARLFHDTEIEKIAFLIADKLSLSSFCFQVMKLRGNWAVTDINARLGAGTAISMAAGMDFFGAMFSILWGQDPSVFFQTIKDGTFVTRQYSEFVMNQ